METLKLSIENLTVSKFLLLRLCPIVMSALDTLSVSLNLSRLYKIYDTINGIKSIIQPIINIDDNNKMFIVAFHLIKFVYTSLQMLNKQFTVTSTNVYNASIKGLVNMSEDVSKM